MKLARPLATVWDAFGMVDRPADGEQGNSPSLWLLSEDAFGMY
ncbi:hypothetical protein [Verrucomicrobium sp. BvORR034]|nr:hypothetical protein [Verrucomicrobium sp. BvORR034]